MKIGIKPYFKYILKENFLYIIIFIALIALSFFIIPFMINRSVESQNKVKVLQEDIKRLETKRRIIDGTGLQGQTNIEDDLELLKRLIPDVESYFSIIFALEELSKQTNFIITSYIINLQSSTQNKLSLTVQGTGNRDSFLTFLKEYNFTGGRLITAEKIEYSADISGGSSLNLNFYTKKVSATNDQNIDYAKTIKKLQSVKEKVKFFLQRQITEESQEDYPTKSNPF